MIDGVVGVAEDTQPAGRLYRELAERLIHDISDGQYLVGERLPGERELALQYGVSRGTVREAIIVLEVLGIVEVRVGSGAHILQLGVGPKAKPKASALEVCEALLMIGGEAAALAAREVRPEEMAEIESALDRLGRCGPRQAETAEREFQLAVARASHNHAVLEMTGRLLDWHAELAECSAAGAGIRGRANPSLPKAVVEALRSGDPNAARAAMRGHLGDMLDQHLARAEEADIAKLRRATELRRSRFRYACD
jgi:GntR family transcriptional repressor for pyruvate dehydrogenase complex